jgi:CRISPR/Cas system-associated protein Cas5 (RAMP superfamily)
VMFALNEESLANHIGERKSRLEAEDVERLEKEKREAEEIKAAEAAELEDEMDMSDI